jgi:NADH pyrophosphatase NudC (nudix superfamily)
MTQKINRYQEQKQARIAQAISTLEVKSDPWGIFAVMPSTTKKHTVYVVVIEDGKASRCDCPGNKEYGHVCVHMIATQFYIDALVEDAAETVTMEEVMEEAQAEMEQHIEEVAIQAERENMQKLADFKLANASDAYEQLALTKKIEYAYGACDHLVKLGHEHDICGGCYQRMYM